MRNRFSGDELRHYPRGPDDVRSRYMILTERRQVHWIVTSETLRLISENKKGWTARKRRSFKESGARAEPGKVLAPAARLAYRKD